MSTFIINLNDTIAMSDSAVVELAKVVNTCQPCVKEAETNCQDVLIVGLICLAVVLVALIAICGLLYWKHKETEAAGAERDAKETEAEIAARKQKADVQGKLLDFLKEQVSSYDIQKKEYEKARDNYKEFLETLINKPQGSKSDEKGNTDQLHVNPMENELKSFLESQLELFAKNEKAHENACEKYINELKNILKQTDPDETEE